MKRKKTLEKMEDIEKVDGQNVRILFSSNLRWFRSLQNFSQASLAHRAGLTHNFINDIENCKRWVSPQTIAKLATVLEIEPYQLFLAEAKAKEGTRLATAERRNDSFRVYLDDFSDSLKKMLRELRRKYLQDDEEVPKPPKSEPEGKTSE
ncbi:MAG: helix-turn-helix transcriptional regulator [Spirochaetaceae bacterium]|jgi:transcriptional regulator with XRE-family HTH domain|nr:helix-turn-helix transcriptional regulator [Spirochaetaceae bacterium]